MNETDTHLTPLTIRLNDQDGSKVSAETFAFLTLAIASHGAQLREASLGRWEIHLENCYDRLVPVLPDLLYFLSSFDILPQTDFKLFSDPMIISAVQTILAFAI